MADKSIIAERAKVLKRRFDIKLKPVKAYLLSRRGSMLRSDWNVLLANTMKSIMDNPSEYLGDDLPTPELTRQTIEYVFEGFLQDIKIRDVQAFRKNGKG